MSEFNKLKPWVKVSVFALAPAIILYFMAVFISLTPNMLDWHVVGRAIYIVISLVFGVFALIIGYDTGILKDD